MCRLSIGSPFVRDALPQRSSRPLVDRVDHPALARAIVGGVAVAVQAGRNVAFGLLLTALVTKMRSPQTIGTRMREAGNRRAPEDVVALLAVPGVGQALPSAMPRRVRSAERRPASGGRRRGRQRSARRWPRCGRSCARGSDPGSPAGRHVLRSRIMRRGVHGVGHEIERACACSPCGSDSVRVGRNPPRRLA